jgi:predicted small integral membrane protein
MSKLTWMAWTWQTAVFFLAIAFLLLCMGIWEWRRPGGSPRRGLFRIDTTRGDRLFISLLGTSYIFLGWLALFGSGLWGAAAVSVVFAGAVFRWV